LINHGADSGTYFTLGEVMRFLDRVGCGSWANRPHDPWQQDATTWPTENQWVEALRRRTQATWSIDLSQTAGLEALKQLLHNGEIAVVRTYQYDNWRSFGNPACQSAGTCPGIDNDVYFENSGTNYGGHDVTIVGYDDDKTYVDSSGQTRAGAFLISNSASPFYGTFNSLYSTANPDPSNPDNRGFMWVAYDFVAKTAPWWRAYYNTDRPLYRPRLYAASGVSATDRLSVTFRGGTGPTTHPRFTSHAALQSSWGTAHPIDPSTRVVVDLTDGLPSVTFTNAYVPLFVELSNCNSAGAAACGATLQNTSFFYDPEGNGIDLSASNAHLQSPDAPKTLAANRPSARACTYVPGTADVNDNGIVDRTDIQSIMNASRSDADCASDPRDLDRSRTISVIDARLGVLKCTKPGCAP
jgi:hypothetical protein